MTEKKNIKENKQAELAWRVEREVIDIKEVSTANILGLGQRFKRIRDDKLYVLLGEDSFTDWLAKPELGYSRTTAYNYIDIFEEFGGIDAARLNLVGHKRLAALLPIVKNLSAEEKSTWLDMAEHLSWKDYINDIRKAQGKPEMPKLGQEVHAVRRGIMTSEDYLKEVKTSECLIPRCGLPSDAHHFPRTKGAGAVGWHVIPLCREHHGLYHYNPKDFLWDNRHAIFDWFYGLIAK